MNAAMIVHENVSKLHQACEMILNSKANGYAKTYAQHGLSVSTVHEARVQALYILNNIQHWREPEAKDTREALKLIANI